jgi:HEAT repeat protein
MVSGRFSSRDRPAFPAKQVLEWYVNFEIITVESMNLSLDKQEGEWYSSLPLRGAVYDLMYTATSEAAVADRLRAVTALGKSNDPRAVRPLADLLCDANPEVRLCATTALGLLKSGRPVDELIARLRDRNELAAIRQQAAGALSAIRSTGALRGLKEFIADEDEDPEIRSYSADLIRTIGPW